MEWIKVTPETIPPEGELVLVTVHGQQLHDVWGNVYYDRDLEHWVEASCTLNPDDDRLVDDGGLKVTHWMPYPEPAED